MRRTQLSNRAVPVILCATVSLWFTAALGADDWPQWRGPNRDGVSKETGLLKKWPDGGPKLLWTSTNNGIGYSSPSVVGDKIYLSGARGNDEFLFCLDAKDGKELWSDKIGPIFDFKNNNWGPGPRASATVDDGLVYILGGNGNLLCADAATGKDKWRKNLPKDLAAVVNPILGGPGGWGFTWSPFVDGEKLVCVPGGDKGLLAALNKKNGEVIWQSKDLPEQAPYASPMPADFGGVHQYVQVTYSGVAGVAAKDGKLLWYYKRKPAFSDVLIATPVVYDSCVFITNGMGSTGGDLVRITKDGDKFKAEKFYANKVLANGTGGVIRVGDCLYGYSEGKGWTCMNFKTGKAAWNEKQALGRGSLIAADGMLYCYTEEDGECALVEANPAEFKLLSKFKMPQESKLRVQRMKTWTPPVIANGRLYLRDQDLLFCFDVSGK
jgi:outer membrane protein assembly factor BamB